MTELRVNAAVASANGDWPEVLAAYERAVTAMQDLDPPAPQAVPTSELGWRYQAAIHGRARADGTPDTSDPAWNQCRHGSWFFLPWHRMYLAAFEQIVQHHLTDPSWRLPYWYAMDPDDPDGARLPPAFVEARPDNALYTEHRSLLANGGHPVVTRADGLVAALAKDRFTQPDDVEGETFGGGEHRVVEQPDAGEVGALEGAPHGSIHVYVGNDYRGQTLVRRGYMGAFETAGLDPIFWLHHANIDRLWQVWLELDPTHTLPDDDTVWTDTRFTFPAPPGKEASWTIAEVVDTANLGYRYDDVSPPSVLGGGVRADIGLAAPEVPVPEPVPHPLGGVPDVALHTTGPVEVPLEAGGGPGLAAAGGGDGRVLLRVEGVRGRVAAPTYGVYVGLPEGADPASRPELRVGEVTTFGLTEATADDELNAGDGLSFTFDMTDAREALMAEGRWQPDRLEVEFVPAVPDVPDDIAAALADLGGEPEEPDLVARQVVVIGT
jgi:tyrosinase